MARLRKLRGFAIDGVPSQAPQRWDRLPVPADESLHGNAAIPSCSVDMYGDSLSRRWSKSQACSQLGGVRIAQSIEWNMYIDRYPRD